MNLRILSFVLFITITCFFSGCYTGNLNQGNNSQDNNLQDNSEYPEYNVDDLNQYGQWTDVYPYGKVWCPSVVNDWQPFTNGHWSYDGYNWVWVSYEPFGWIVYHYGSWEYSQDLGWFWIPGDESWTPACVQWIDYGDYVGWAPRRAYNRIWPEPWEHNNVHPWMLVSKGDFNRENINSYRIHSVSQYDNPNQIQRREPDVKTIQRYVKEPIPIVKFEREPVVTNNPPVRTENPPNKNDNSTPPVTRGNNNSTPPVTRGNNNTKPRTIVHMQIPPAERQKVNKYRPKVEKDVLKKKNPPPTPPQKRDK
ncbi:MAG: hypothetical protein P4L35_10535 [Ignavibacteriaceae bacterium]|nr:hypothetical protein [Ignavibacteriaceae bacterium]